MCGHHMHMHTRVCTCICVLMQACLYASLTSPTHFLLVRMHMPTSCPHARLLPLPLPRPRPETCLCALPRTYIFTHERAHAPVLVHAFTSGPLAGQASAEADAANADGLTPLMLAANNGDVQAVELLLEVWHASCSRTADAKRCKWHLLCLHAHASA